MIARIMILLILLSVFACNKKVKKAELGSNAEGKEELISQEESKTQVLNFDEINMIKSPCRGYCPQYDVTVDKFGNASLTGKRNIDFIGMFKGKIGKQDLSRIDALVAECDFYNLESEYSKNIMDIPNTYLTCSKGENKKKVTVQTGAPALLDSLISNIHEIVVNGSWEKVSDLPDSQKIKGGLRNN